MATTTNLRNPLVGTLALTSVGLLLLFNFFYNNFCIAFDLDYCHGFPTNCGIGSVLTLPGLLEPDKCSVLGTGQQQLTLFFDINKTGCNWYEIPSSSPICRVGSWLQLSGLVVSSSTQAGVGSLFDCPNGTGLQPYSTTWYNWDNLHNSFLLHWIERQPELSTPTHCRVGPWLQLTGLLVCSLGSCELGRRLTQFSCEFNCDRLPNLGVFALKPGEEAWFPGSSTFCRFGPCLLLTGLLSDLGATANTILCNIHFRYWWRLIWFILYNSVQYTLLLAKVALEWFVLFALGFLLVRGGTQFELPFAAPAAECTRRSPGGESGPKSRRNLGYTGIAFCYCKLLLVALCWSFSVSLMTDCRGEGNGLAMEVVEAPTAWISTLADSDGAKQHGMRPLLCNRTQIRLSTANKVVKRSLLRAAKRAKLFGLAWYRGRSYTLADFEQMGCFPPVSNEANSDGSATLGPDLARTGKANDVTNCSQHHSPKGRMKCWMWNCGGLSLAKFDEVKLWLSMQMIDVAVLLESKWSFDSEWADSTWNYIHSGSGNFRGQGILVMIRKTFCPGTRLLWQHIVPGRMLHVRILLGGRPIDVVAGYQHTYNGTNACLKDRESWWTKLESLLNSVPKRNSLVLLGDFNTSLHQLSSHVGTSTFRWKGHLSQGTVHADTGRFMSLLRFFGLVALNSWSSALGPTYVHHDQASRLDFFCVRKFQADGPARTVQYLWQCPFLDSSKVGHVPMMFTMAKYWIPENHDVQTHGISVHQRQVCRQEYYAQTPRWIDFSARIAADIVEEFDKARGTASCPLDNMHGKLLNRTRQTFSTTKIQNKPEPWTMGRSLMLNKWKHRSLMKRMVFSTPRNVFKAWFHLSRFLTLRRQHRRAAYAFRKVQFQDIVASASAAARQHDTHRLFSIINQYSPKQPRRKVQLRNTNGTMASPVESAAILHHYVAETWAGPAELGLQFTCAPGVPFSELQLRRALALIPLTKAVANPFAPGLVLRDQAALLAPLLFEQLTDWWSRNPPYIPKSWKDGWVCFIPKPQKPPVKPQFLRPLALQDGIGKAVIGILIQQALDAALPRLVPWPIFAFLPIRSTQDAIRRVVLHCTEVRNLIRSHRSTPHQRASRNIGDSSLKCFGGLQLFIDLTRAFDCVDRRRLFSRLFQLDIPAAHIQLLSAWHEGTSYHVQTDHGFQPIAIGKGVRQGCKAAPSLFNFFLYLFLHDVCQVLPVEWVKAHLTAYADDCHVCGSFRTFADFEFIRQAFGVLFATLRSLDMQINPEKSVAILAMSGSSHRKHRCSCIHRDQQGEKLRIDVPGAEPVFVPLHHSTKYLGVIVSYGGFEDASLHHRKQLTHIGFQRLKRWLTGRNALTITQKFQMWRSCILPILTYGIFAVGITPKGLQQATTAMTLMLRQLIGDHAYLTGHSNRQALANFHLPTPAQLLHGAAASLWQSVTQREFSLTANDILLQIHWGNLTDLLSRLAQVQASESLESSWTAVTEAQSVEPTYSCRLCPFSTANPAWFRRHCTIVHGFRMHRTQFHNFTDHMIDGLPQCKHCGLQFSTWRSFKTHVERGCQAILRGPEDCLHQTDLPGRDVLGSSDPHMQVAADVATRNARMLDPAELAHVQSLEFGNRLLCIIQDSDWHLLQREPSACAYLSRQCILCGHHFSRTQELHLHYRQVHPDRWEHAPQKSVQLTNLHATESPCQFCGSLFKTHQCVVWSQISVLLVNGAHLLALSDSGPIDIIRHRCDICLAMLPTVAELTQHLQREHGLQGLAFNPSRDSIDGCPACAHCGSTFLSMHGLKTHIVQGRCEEFNPQATAETQSVDPRWAEACLHGKLAEVLQSPLNRMGLTIRCQQCGKGCQRAADLALHLQSSHSRLWKASQRLLMVLVDVFYNSGQCVCNPKTGIKRANHVCLPYRQLAMSFLRMKQEPFAPMRITDTLLSCTLSSKLAATDRFHIEQLLSARNFGALWQDPDLRTLLSSCCLFCGATHTAADLAIHIREAHPKGHGTMLFYMEQLMPVVTELHEVDHQCCLCKQIYNLPLEPSQSAADPARQAVAQSHLKGCCPNLLQISLLLARLLHGSGFGYGTARRDGSDAGAGNVSIPCTLTGRSHTQTVPEPKGPETSTQRRPKRARLSRPSGRGKGTTSAPTFEDTDAAGASPRPGTQQSTKDGSIHLFFEQRQDRGTSASASLHLDLETAGGDCVDLCTDAPETISDLRDGEAPPQAPGAADGVPGVGTTVPDVHREGGDSEGSKLPIPQVGPEHSTALLRQEDSDQWHTDGATLGRAGRDDQRSDAHSAVPCIEAVGEPGDQDHPLEDAIASAVRQTVRTDASPLIQLGMDADWSNPQASHTGDERPCPSTAETDEPTCGQGQRKGQREDGQAAMSFEDAVQLSSNMCGLTLANSLNWCYANSTISCLLWTLLCLFPVSFHNWGTRSAELQDFLRRVAGDSLALTDEQWFCQILHFWGGTNSQQDCAEFSLAVLKWLGSPAFSLRWERRCELDSEMHIMDHSDTCTPIKLEFTLSLDSTGHCTLQDLVRPWCQVDSMSTALTTASICLCIQLDRFVQNDEGHMWKTACSVDFDQVVTFPFFVSNDLRTEVAEYQIVAGACHLGQDLAGHYRAAMRLRPGLDGLSRPVKWMVTDDATRPEPVWEVPAWMKRNATVLWLIRSDSLHMFPFQLEHVHQTQSHIDGADQEDLLGLLAAQPGVQMIETDKAE